MTNSEQQAWQAQGWQRFSEEDMEEESDGEGALVPLLGFVGAKH